MGEISTNRTVRRQQFKAAARNILADARSPWGTADRVGQLASAMERAYAAGAASAGKPEEAVDAAGHVRWEAIPRRSQEILQDVAFSVCDRFEDIRTGNLVVAIEGAGETSARGIRAHMSLWKDDGEFLHRVKEEGNPEWAASSVSALVRLGMFEVRQIENIELRFVTLTLLGLATIETAVAEGNIYLSVAGLLRRDL